MNTPTSDAHQAPPSLELEDAESVLFELASVFFRSPEAPGDPCAPSSDTERDAAAVEFPLPNLEAMYRALVEQIPAVVFMAYLDPGIGKAYVSPRIEEALGFTQDEWLEDPVRWYNQIHPADKQRWSIEAADIFLTGRPVRSAYRVLARDGRVIWFHCEAKMIRRENGRPWFIHGIGFDITDLKRTEQTLQEERNVVAAILDTVRALVVVLDDAGVILRANRACEQITGYSAAEMRGKKFEALFLCPGDTERSGHGHHDISTTDDSEYESDLVTAGSDRRRIAWTNTVLPGGDASSSSVIATGIDVTERKRMEQAILDVSTRVQRQIGRDLHDGLGQHLTGIAFMSKVLEQKLATGGALEPAADAAKIVELVNEAINKTRELSRGLLPVVSDVDGLMSALKLYASEVEDLFHVRCAFVCAEPLLMDDVGTATHLYHIAQEAVNNALRHASPHRIEIAVEQEHDFATMSVADDGAGLVAATSDRPGLGLHIMSYRANLIGGSLDVRRGTTGGTVVSCRFPTAARGGSA